MLPVPSIIATGKRNYFQATYLQNIFNNILPISIHLD